MPVSGATDTHFPIVEGLAGRLIASGKPCGYIVYFDRNRRLK